MTSAELGDVRELIEDKHAELSAMFSELKSLAFVAAGNAAQAAGIELESARLLELQFELRRFLVERWGQNSLPLRRSV